MFFCMPYLRNLIDLHKLLNKVIINKMVGKPTLQIRVINKLIRVVDVGWSEQHEAQQKS